MEKEMKFPRTLALVLTLCLAAVSLGAQREAAPPPFSLDHLLDVLRNIKMLGSDQVVGMIQKRGVDFRYSEAARRSLQKGGATEEVLRAVSRAAEERSSKIRSQPLIAPVQVNTEPQVELPPPLSPKEQAALLEKAREQALSYSRGLPSFICLQVTRRHVDTTGRGDWILADVFNAKLSYEKEKGEHYQIISVNNKYTDIPSMEALGGSTSSGEFGTMLNGIFEPERETHFAWRQQAGLRGRATEVFDFYVEQQHSIWRITYMKSQTIVTAFRGRVWIDRETAEVLSLAMVAEDIPPDFPIRMVAETLDYDWATISGLRFLLPAKALMQMAESRYVSKNEITFRLYQKFSADTSIKFDIPDEEEKPAEKQAPPAKKKQ
jgi:hypothetical protein